MPTQLFKRGSEVSQSSENGIEDQLTEIADETGDFERSDSDRIDFTLELDNATIEDKPSPMYSTDPDSSNSLQDIVRLLNQPGEAVPSTLLSPLSEPVPDNWVTLEENFVTVMATYQSHLGSDVIIAPDAKFTDGIIHLCIMKAGIQKSELISVMTKLEKGTHIDHESENIEFVKVLAFRLEPENDQGIIMIDGEKVDCKATQGQVLPGLANLMAIQ